GTGRGRCGGLPLGKIRLVASTGHMKTTEAPDFKARCLAVLDHVSATGEPVVILQRGQPVVELGAVRSAAPRYPQAGLEGTVTVVGDIVEPALAEAEREALKQ
ncbi:MAG: type II toxin-antitoxin system Phd/YefM family antitoxin, partial [Alphaproteobacteria bacterium]|nr:type II toxin-antitoxin system Phd/YefM family antitoxin [Alphaproteobacteria bacterium]